jgi:hypothetical protein
MLNIFGDFMKLRLLLLGFLFSSFIISCDNSTDSNVITLPAELGVANIEIKSELDGLSAYMNKSIDTLKQLDFTTEESKVRQILRNIDGRYLFIDEALIVSNKGVLDMIEPAKYKSSEGTDVSYQEHIQRLLTKKVPVTSKLFYVVEGYYAIVYTIPVIKNGDILFSLTVLIDPTRLLGVKLESISKNKDFTFFVLEDTGVVLWDPDSTEVGRNTLTDSLYQQYPEVIKACTKVTQNESGTTSYTFFNTGMNKVDKFDVWWNSTNFIDSHWKIVYKKENMQ